MGYNRKDNKRDMRYALCLHGLIGSLDGKSGASDSCLDVLDLAYKHLSKYILDKNNIDIFIHSWDVEYTKEILEKFKPIKSNIEIQMQFEGERRIKNHYSRWYSFMQSVKLKTEYENENNFKYDGVMVSRFDVAWLNQIKFNKYNMDYFYVSQWYKGDKIRKDKNKIKDIWFLSSSKNINQFSNLYLMLDDYNKIEKLKHKKLGISSHYLAKYHCDENKLKIKKILKLDEGKRGVINVENSDYSLIRHKYSNKNNLIK
tara:strand:+ start:7809 stop:8582 length:774 start_codon:yes stop_codon:yes gene_type:complete